MFVASALEGLVVLAVLLGIYFLPSIIAFDKGDPNKLSIGVINLFLGWTLIGWVVALAMALRSRKEPMPTTFIEAAPPLPDTADKVGKLADLHREGLLSDDEFAAAKARLLG